MSRRLLDSGGNLEVRDEYGYTPLLSAAAGTMKRDAVEILANERQCNHCVRVLLDAGADKEARDNEGYTALLLAVDQGRTAIVQTLLEAGVDVNAALPQGMTPLMVATRLGQLACARLLLAAKADKGLVCDEGKTALQWAEGTMCGVVGRPVAYLYTSKLHSVLTSSQIRLRCGAERDIDPPGSDAHVVRDKRLLAPSLHRHRALCRRRRAHRSGGGALGEAPTPRRRLR